MASIIVSVDTRPYLEKAIQSEIPFGEDEVVLA